MHPTTAFVMQERRRVVNIATVGVVVIGVLAVLHDVNHGHHFHVVHHQPANLGHVLFELWRTVARRGWTRCATRAQLAVGPGAVPPWWSSLLSLALDELKRRFVFSSISSSSVLSARDFMGPPNVPAPALGPLH